MAKNTEKVRVSRQWTNERHVNFLNSMEASFVHSMFHNQNNGRLDRYLPDTSDSTHDLPIHSHTPTPTPTPTFLSNSASESGGRRTQKKTRNLGCQKSSQDQVVPQIRYKREDKDKDDHLDVSIGTAQ